MNKIKLDIPIECPSCKRKQKKQLSTLKNGHTFKCICGQSFKVDGSGFQQVQKSFNDFSKSIEKMNRRMKIGI